MNSLRNDPATLLAVTEVLPAEWRDLSDLLDQYANINAILSDTANDRGDMRGKKLVLWIQKNLDSRRVAFWRVALAELKNARPPVRFIPLTSREYPRNLRRCYDRPPFIFSAGHQYGFNARSLAIVGSRDASDEALSAARVIAAEAVSRKITVVSGLASGVDSAAHEAALTGDGRTIGVLGSGIDSDGRLDDSDSLVSRVAHSGILVSQFRPGSPATRSSFPMRNAVISGLSKVSVIVQAGEHSGARNEADHALRHGRPTLLWGPIMRKFPWAHRFVTACEARFVDSAAEVVAEVS